jgi:hypothetical protein
VAEQFIVNSKHTLELAKSILEENFSEKKFTIYHLRHGEHRSLNQNALFHVWALEWGCFISGLNPKALNTKEKKLITEGTKRAVKKRFYCESGYPWLIIEIENPFTKERKKDFSSSGDWLQPEMFTALTWMQATAANDGLILESKGEFKKLQESSLG